jgi:integrase
MSNVSKITHDGVTLSLKQWSEKTGIPPATIKSRLGAGWPLADALGTPVDRRFARGGRRKAGGQRPCPELKEHPTSGQAYCRWSERGKDTWRYFGAWGSEDAKRLYRRFSVEWAAGATTGTGVGETTVGRLIVLWLAHCERTYRKRGKVTSEYHCNRSAMRYLNELYGDEPAAGMTVRNLRAVRERMVGEGWTRKTINDHGARLVRAFQWAAAEQLVPLPVAQTLALFAPLAAGRRDDVPENEPVEPVPAAHVAAVLASPALHPTPNRRAVLVAMIRVQLLTGMRPGELCALAPPELDRSAEPWRYETTEYNKMLHKNLSRVVFFGPQARALLAPLLADCPPDSPAFRFPPWRKKADFTPVSAKIYRARIAAACSAAGVPVWTPNRLRHNKATEVMDAYESDAATAAVLGNTPEVARQVYASRAGESVARRIAEETG